MIVFSGDARVEETAPSTLTKLLVSHDHSMDVPVFDPNLVAADESLDRVIFDAPQGAWSLTTRLPVLDLADCVIRLWEAHGFSDYSREKILPHGCYELIFNLGGPHRTLDLADLSPTGTFNSAWIAGLQEHALIAAPTYDTLRWGSLLVGATIRAHGARQLLGTDGQSLSRAVVELSDLMDSHQIELMWEQLRSVRDTSARFDLLESFLRRVRGANQRPISDCVLWGLDLISQTQGNVLIDEICRHAVVSRKHLNERFRDEIGLSPKKYARILRFASVIETIASASTVNWAEAAVEAGYYDQSHFVREFRSFSGETPADFLRARSVDGKTILYD